ncbi:MAG: sulfatase-like hydrolase/transferase [Akkermansiaceae bacterium]
MTPQGILRLGVLMALAHSSLSGEETEVENGKRADGEVQTQPNFIVVFIDDMGFSDFSCFGGVVKTEHVDRLAAEGMRFTSFYVNSPICSPSRVALTTGQYPFRWRISSYLANREANRKRGMAQWLDPEAPVLARRLKEVGYATGHFGKWHMGGQRDVDDAPAISKYGFDRSLTNFEGMGAKLLPLTLKPDPKGGNPIKGRIWRDAERLGKGAKWMQRSEITSGFVSAALEFIDEARKQKKPFYLNLWPDDVHSPFWPPLEKWGGNKRELYRGVLDSMDEQLARLFDRVRSDSALKDNTVIVVCSDNGHEPGAGESKPFRGAKTWLYEGGIRSPLIVWAPGLMPAEQMGQTNNNSVFCALDLNRSLYEMAGVAPKEKLDGEDLSDVLVGKSEVSREAPIFWRRPPDRPGFGHGFQEDNPDLAVREGRWKFLVNFDGSTPQLFDLSQDRSESRNLVKKHPDVVTRMDRMVRAWNAVLPVDGADPRFKKPRPAKKQRR